MSAAQDTPFLEDKVIFIISSLGLVFVFAAVFWVVRQSPDWGAIHEPQQEQEDGDAAVLGGRTRVVPGGRAALKAARKEAKKRAKEEFKASSAGLKRRNRKELPTKLGRSQVDWEQRHEDARKARSEEVLRRIESHILNRKVSSLECLEVEINMPTQEIAAKIDELEARGVFKGIMIDDAREKSGRSFVRINTDEMHTLAAFINERGRLPVIDFVAEANRVLQLSRGEMAQQTRKFLLQAEGIPADVAVAGEEPPTEELQGCVEQSGPSTQRNSQTRGGAAPAVEQRRGADPGIAHERP